LAVICGAVIAAAACLLYVWQGTRILALTAQKESIEQMITSIEEVNNWLDFQIGEAFSLKRVSRIAREQLNMKEPTDIRYVYIDHPATEK
jgi:cell division protein FtsL